MKRVASNMTQLETSTHIILFSYQTPVACKDKKTGRISMTSDSVFAATTNQHMSKWKFANRNNHKVLSRPQKFFDELATVASVTHDCKA